MERLEEAGVRIVRGTGRLDGPGRVRVEDDTYVGARGVLLGVGTSPATPPIDGLAATPYWTNREIVKVTELPGSLAVIGGGAIGCELAQAFSRFGSEVTILETADRILSAEEPESSELLTRVLRDEGLRVEVGLTVERVDHDGAFRISTDRGEIVTDQLLVAAGRSPNLRGIGLDTVGLDPDADDIDTDERMRAGERLWAVGDITGHGAFTHVSMYQARSPSVTCSARTASRRLPRGDPGDLHRPGNRIGRDDRAAGARRRPGGPGRSRRPGRVQPRLDPRPRERRAAQAGRRC